MRRGGSENLRPGARLFEVARGAIAGDIGEAASLAGRARLLGALRNGRGRVTLAFLAVLAVPASVATAARALPGHGPDAAPASLAEGNEYVSAGTTTPMVRFAGASHVDFAPGSRGRIGELGPTRARVVLEAGQANVYGEGHHPGGFLVEAGPYALRGGGGAFEVSWSGSVLHVRVASGAVRVEGPAARQGLTLSAGQSFEARDANEEMRCF